MSGTKNESVQNFVLKVFLNYFFFIFSRNEWHEERNTSGLPAQQNVLHAINRGRRFRGRNLSPGNTSSRKAESANLTGKKTFDCFVKFTQHENVPMQGCFTPRVMIILTQKEQAA